MGRKKSKSTLEIAERVYIKRNDEGDCWYYYFTLHGHVFRASTKTVDRNRATFIAMQAYYDALDRNRWNVSFDRVSFEKLCKKYLETLTGQSKARFHSETINRHFMNFFRRYDDITKIDSGILQDYLIYRKQKTGHTVLNQSLNKENAVFNQMMRLALEYGWIKKQIKFQRQSEAQSYNRRAHFTQSEYETLVKVAQRRCDECVNGISAKDRGRLTHTYWQRCLLRDIILVLANTGMRVDEIKTVTWRDINWSDQRITLRSAGKTKSSRVLLVRDEGMKALSAIRERRQEYIKDKGTAFLEENEKVQSLATGVSVKSMHKSFNDLLRACGFKYKSIKDKHSLTSLRHTYATLRLTTQSGARATTRSLSKQMGTSEKMIEKHYGHDVVENYRDELLG